ncbi:hypothetical protein H6F95_25370 [Cyanobacteria bacterium FACHB-471]|nr:hypothetical protein [Cyanobacteria bacterium FACHB-471]
MHTFVDAGKMEAKFCLKVEQSVALIGSSVTTLTEIAECMALLELTGLSLSPTSGSSVSWH